MSVLDKSWESVPNFDPSSKEWNQLAGATDPNFVFKINDVILHIPPSQITVVKEDMVWSWKTLRTKASTKVPSGHGVCHVSLNVVFTPDLLLHLHRLVVQFRHSPFCWIENQFLRESIVPNWPVWQKMAYTMTSLNVSSMKGHPGSFIAEIELRWFNYFPYNVNFYFRKEWKTRPLFVEGGNEQARDIKIQQPKGEVRPGKRKATQKTIETFGPRFESQDMDLPWTKYDLEKFYKKNRITGMGKLQQGKRYQRFNQVTKKQKSQSTYTLDQLYKTHYGQVFDLAPLPDMMEPSQFVHDPSLSNIYVRYINTIQQRELFLSFGIDVAAFCEGREVKTGFGKQPLWWDFTYGKEAGRGLVQGLHTGNLPSDVRDKIISKMLSYGHGTYLYYDDYRALNYSPKLNKILKARKKSLEPDYKKATLLDPKNINREKKLDKAKKTYKNKPKAKESRKLSTYVDKVPIRVDEVSTETLRAEEHLIIDKAIADPFDVNTKIEPDIPSYLWCISNRVTGKKSLGEIGYELYNPSTDAYSQSMVPPVEGTITVTPLEHRHTSWSGSLRGEDEMLAYQWHPPLRAAELINAYGTFEDADLDHSTHGKGVNTDAWKAHGTKTIHSGIDISNEEGTVTDGAPVFAIERGYVRNINDERTTVVIEHRKGDTLAETWGIEFKHSISSVYSGLHATDLLVGKGQIVERGEVIGFVGGTSTNNDKQIPHLHFEILYGSERRDPWEELQRSMSEVICTDPAPKAKEEVKEGRYTKNFSHREFEGWGRTGGRNIPIQATKLVIEKDKYATAEDSKNDGCGKGNTPKDNYFYNKYKYDPERLKVAKNLKDLADSLEIIKAELSRQYGGSVSILISPNGGLRLPLHIQKKLNNGKEIYLSKTRECSHHCTGMAADIQARADDGTHVPMWQIYATIVKLIKANAIPQGGLGTYAGGSVHYDVSGVYRRWIWCSKSKWKKFQKANFAGFKTNVFEYETHLDPAHKDYTPPAGGGEPTIKIGDPVPEDEYWVYAHGRHFNVTNFVSEGEAKRVVLFLHQDQYSKKYAYNNHPISQARKTRSPTAEEDATDEEVIREEEEEVNFNELLLKRRVTDKNLCEKDLNKKKAILPEDAKIPYKKHGIPNSDWDKLSEDEKGIIATITTLRSDGWTPYESNEMITNVWKKSYAVYIQNSNFNYDGVRNHFQILGMDPSLLNDPNKAHGLLVKERGVVTGVSGGLRHIVATIPILSHEFPTHQHLGSIEPEYNFEIVSFADAQGPSGMLDGLGTTGTMIESVRSLLQQNSRSFRSIPDSWTCSIDSFITRLFGTFKSNDVTFTKETSDNSEMSSNGKSNTHVDLNKRSAITSTTNATREGSPGTNIIQLLSSETNPFVTENIVMSGSTGPSQEEKRKIVLHKLLETGKLTEREANQQNLRTLIDTFGKTHIVTKNDDGDVTDTDNLGNFKDQNKRTMNIYSNSPIENWDDKVEAIQKGLKKGEKRIIVSFAGEFVEGGKVYTAADSDFDKSQFALEFAKRTGMEPGYQKSPEVFSGVKTPDAAERPRGGHIRDKYRREKYGIPIEGIRKYFKDFNSKRAHTSWASKELAAPGLKIDNVSELGSTAQNMGGYSADGSSTPSAVVIDVTGIFEHYKWPIDTLTSEGLTGMTPFRKKEKAYFDMLENIIRFSRYALAEHDTNLPGAFDKKFVTEKLYDLPIEGKMYSNYLYWMYLWLANLFVNQWAGNWFRDTVGAMDAKQLNEFIIGDAKEANAIMNDPKFKKKTIRSGLFSPADPNKAKTIDQRTMRFEFNKHAWGFGQFNVLRRGNFTSMTDTPEAWNDNLNLDYNWVPKGGDKWETAESHWANNDVFSLFQEGRNTDKVWIENGGGINDVDGSVDWKWFNRFNERIKSNIEKDFIKAANEYKEIIRAQIQICTNHYMQTFVVADFGLTEQVINEHLQFLSDYLRPRNEEGVAGRPSYMTEPNVKRFGIYPQLDDTFYWLVAPTDYYDETDRKISGEAKSKAKGTNLAFRTEPNSRSDQMNKGKNLEPSAFLNALKVNGEWENNKVSHIKKMLMELADNMLSNIEFLQKYKLMELYDAGYGVHDYPGLGAYPDMDLPHHPYYPSDMNVTNPDFYFWNIYQDANLERKKAFEASYAKSLKKYITAPRDFLKKMQKDGIHDLNDIFGHPGKEKQGESGTGRITISALQSGESGTSMMKGSAITSHWEGTDDLDLIKSTSKNDKVVGGTISKGGGKLSHTPKKHWISLGPTGEAFRQANDEKDPKKAVKHKAFEEMAKYYGGLSNSGVSKNDLSQIRRVELNQNNKDIEITTPFSNYDTNPQYSSRAELDDYKQLRTKIRSIEQMFGSKAGYQGELIRTKSDLGKELSDTAVATLDSYTHVYGEKEIEKLCIDSSRDITAEKICMRRAFPTFKLFFVEEDEFESRWLNLDDFYSFNGVKEFTVHSSRKQPATTATITLQNVAGTLDGTKRHVITDLDYYISGRGKEDGDKEQKGGANTPITSDDTYSGDRIAESSKSKPFGAIVLRTGLNVQLRAGYANNPDNLEVLISGRVTDVSWNSRGDMAEIVVQSFGAELAQVRKGMDNTFKSGKTSFKATHHLLGSLMLNSPELKHFGRWEHGNLTQIGESKDYRLDFFSYTKDQPWAIGAITGWTRWVMENPVTMSLLATGVLLLSVFPPTGLASRATAVGGRLYSVPAIGKWGVMGAAKLPFWATGKLLGGMGRMGAWTAGKVLPSSVVAWGGRNIPWIGGVSGSNVFKWAASGGGYRTIAPAADDALATALKSAIAVEGAVAQRLAIAKAFGEHVLGRAAVETILKTTTVAGGAQARAIYAAILRNVGAGATKAVLPAYKKLIMKNLVQLMRHGVPAGEAGITFLTKTANMFHANTMVRAYGYIGGLAAGGGTGLVGAGAGAARMGFHSVFGLKYGLLGKAFGLMPIRTAMVFGAGAVAMAGMKKYIINPLYDTTYGKLKRAYTRGKVHYMLSPQDDNLFPPNPSSYMKIQFGWEESVIEALTTGAGAIISTFTWSGSTGTSAAEGLKGMWNMIRYPAVVLMDKRIFPEEAKYIIRNNTIWEIFHEMSLRHPGWIYGCKPYGKKFEYRMFFGVPSQRWWSKPVSNGFVARMNDIRKKFGNNADSASVSKANFVQLYGLNEYKKLLGRTADKYKIDKSKVTSNSKANKELKILMTAKALSEYLKGLEARFVPYRRYHHVSSEIDLVSNNIISSDHNVVNAVSVTYHSANKDIPTPKQTVQFKAHSSIPEEMIKMGSLNLPNCRGYRNALRYGMGYLIHSMKEMYRGELLLLGNPRIRPWDICIIEDYYNDMAGPVEVEAVTHMFSHETGFLTEIKPNAVTIGNEISSWPVLEGLKVIQLGMNFLQEGKEFTPSADLFKYNSMWADFLDMGAKQEDEALWQEYLNERWDSVREGFPNTSGLWNHITGGPGAYVEDGQAKKYGESGYRRTGSSSVVRYVGALGGVGLGLGAVALSKKVGFSVYGRISEKFLKSGSSAVANSTTGLGAKANTGFVRKGAKIAGYSAGAIAGGSMGSDYASSFFNLEDFYRGNSILSYYVGGHAVMMKALREETVIVVPLMKDGRPIISGLGYKDPFLIWRNLMGEVVNAVTDTLQGTEEVWTDMKSEGFGIYKFIETYWDKGLFHDPETKRDRSFKPMSSK